MYSVWLCKHLKYSRAVVKDVRVLIFYLCLNHEHSLSSELLEKLKDIEVIFLLHSLQHAIQDNKGSSPPHSCAAVYQQGARVRVWMNGTNTPDEIDEYNSVLWYPVIRPTKEMELNYFLRGNVWSSRLRYAMQLQLIIRKQIIL